MICGRDQLAFSRINQYALPLIGDVSEKFGQVLLDNLAYRLWTPTVRRGDTQTYSGGLRRLRCARARCQHPRRLSSIIYGQYLYAYAALAKGVDTWQGEGWLGEARRVCGVGEEKEFAILYTGGSTLQGIAQILIGVFLGLTVDHRAEEPERQR